MDTKSVRSNLTEVTTQLARNEEEHEVLVSLVRGYEGWLRLNPDPQPPPQMIVMFEPEGRGSSSQPKGSRSMRGAVLQVLKDARGEPVHGREILARAIALGAATDAKNPLGAVDLMAHSLKKSHPVEKVGPRVWRYRAPENRDGAPM
jgi:hypothetical protein